MSTKGKYTTIYNIIERIKRSGIDDFTEEEVKEWIWEVISLMGTPASLVKKVAVIPIENARGALPYDLSDISEGGVRDYYTKRILIKNEDLFYDANNVGQFQEPTNLMFEAPSVVYLNGVPVDEGKGFITEVPKKVYEIEDSTYRINNGFIETGFRAGIVEMAYKAFPVDNENNPMIEDNVKTIRAVVNYISLQVINRMWLRDEVSDKKKLHFEREYDWAIAAARSDTNLGSIDDWDAIRARTNRLYRDPNLHKTGFKGLGQNEGLNL